MVTAIQSNRPANDMTDEERLISLLHKHRELTERLEQFAGFSELSLTAESEELEQERQQVSDDILELVDTYFRRALRPVLTKLFGAKVAGRLMSGNRRGDGSLRYTEMVNDFFVKILEKQPDAFWKAETAKELRTWSSVVIRNQMLDYLRRKKRGREILAEIAPLVEQKQTYFESRYATTFEDFLDQLAAWETSGSGSLVLQAAALRHRYVDGMTWGQIAEQLGISDERLTELRKAAAERFKQLQQ